MAVRTELNYRNDTIMVFFYANNKKFENSGFNLMRGSTFYSK